MLKPNVRAFLVGYIGGFIGGLIGLTIFFA